MIAAGQHDELEQRVFEAYKQLESRFDAIVCEGTDFSGVLPALDFELNVSLANQLGCPVLVVIKGSSVSGIASAVRIARASLTRKGSSLFGVIASRVPDELMAEMRNHSVIYDPGQPLYVLPENPALGLPTIAQVAEELGAEVLVGGPDQLHREVSDVRVAAMSVEHFLADLVGGTLVIVPGDRADILLASLVASRFPALPAVAGHPPDRVLRAGGADPRAAQRGALRRAARVAPAPIRPPPRYTRSTRSSPPTTSRRSPPRWPCSKLGSTRASSPSGSPSRARAPGRR